MCIARRHYNQVSESIHAGATQTNLHFSRCASTIELIYGQIFRFSRVYMHFRAQKCRTKRRQGRTFGRPRNFDCYFPFFGTRNIPKPSFFSLCLDWIADIRPNFPFFSRIHAFSCTKMSYNTQARQKIWSSSKLWLLFPFFGHPLKHTQTFIFSLRLEYRADIRPNFPFFSRIHAFSCTKMSYNTQASQKIWSSSKLWLLFNNLFVKTKIYTCVIQSLHW